jgi:hypothetical protein
MSDTTEAVPEKAPFQPRVLTPFEVKVLSVALAATRTEGWCIGGLNSALRELGIPEKPEERYGYRQITAKVPTSSTVTFQFDLNSTAEERERELNRYIERNNRYNTLEYGSRTRVEYDLVNVAWEGLEEPTKSDDELQWDAQMLQVQAYRSGNPDADHGNPDVDDEL